MGMHQEGSWCTKALRRGLADPSALSLGRGSKGYVVCVFYAFFLCPLKSKELWFNFKNLNYKFGKWYVGRSDVLIKLVDAPKSHALYAVGEFRLCCVLLNRFNGKF